MSVDPVIERIDLDLVPPTLHDLRSDTVRLTDALAELGVSRPFYGQPILRTLSTQTSPARMVSVPGVKASGADAWGYQGALARSRGPIAA